MSPGSLPDERAAGEASGRPGGPLKRTCKLGERASAAPGLGLAPAYRQAEPGPASLASASRAVISRSSIVQRSSARSTSSAIDSRAESEP